MSGRGCHGPATDVAEAPAGLHAALKIPVVARSGADLGGDEWDALSTTKELVDRPHAYVCENP